MPPKGWATVSIREDVRRALEEIASQKGFSSLNDVIAFLLDKYREFTDVSVKLTDVSVRCDKLLTDISVKLDALLQSRGSESSTTTTAMASVESSTQSKPATVTVKGQPRERRRVIVFSLDWARQKGINVEEYMARREREGYTCNEANRKAYCIWREDIEQIVVELNSSNAGMDDLERVLSGEKLEIARTAVEAGLMWYDNKEKRWRASL
ncbi:MAG: hypothetical protein LM558_01210 [Thermosphaera sp.]|nr:hypothetical protein [Thermosphaera sp.]